MVVAGDPQRQLPLHLHPVRGERPVALLEGVQRRRRRLSIPFTPLFQRIREDGADSGIVAPDVAGVQNQLRVAGDR